MSTTVNLKRQSNQNPPAIQRQNGFNLVDILISLVISAFIMAGVVQLYSDSHRNNIASMAFTSLQDSARLGLMLLENDIRLVNFQGCSDPYTNYINVAEGTLLANSPGFTDLYDDSLLGFEVDDGTWADGEAYLTAIKDDAIIGSDVLTLRFANSSSVPLNIDMANKGSTIEIAQNLISINQGDMLLISSCLDAAVFKASAVTPGVDPGDPVTISHSITYNTSADFNATFDTTATIHRLTSHTYYVANNPSGSRSLFRRDREGNNIELVEGVENMQILYGQRISDNTIDLLTDDMIRYVAADDADLDMTEVDRIQIAFLISSPISVFEADAAAGYSLLGTTVPPANTDRLLRKVVKTTVLLQNRRPH